MKADMGTPRRLTQEVHQRIIEHIDQGNYPEVAAQLAGIPRRTFERWLHDGREDLEQGLEDSSVAALARDVERARAEVVARKVRRIQEAGEKQWQADAWWLERNFPDMYGGRFEAKIEQRSVSIQVSVPSGALPALERLMARKLPGEMITEGETAPTRALPEAGPG